MARSNTAAGSKLRPQRSSTSGAQNKDNAKPRAQHRTVTRTTTPPQPVPSPPADPHMPSDEKQRTLYQALRARPHRAPHYLDISSGLFDVMGRGAMEEVHYRLDRVGWKGLIELSDPCYPPLTAEVLSTYSYSDDGASFTVAGKPQHITRRKIASAFGWEKDRYERIPSGTEFRKFWTQITGSADPYNTKTSTVTQIIDPIYRVLLRAVAATLTARTESTNKVNLAELWFLYCLHRGRKADFVQLLNIKIREIVTAPSGDVHLGGFCTRLAMATKAFDPATTSLVPLPASRPIDCSYCVRLGIFTRTVVDKKVLYRLDDRFSGPWPCCPSGDTRPGVGTATKDAAGGSAETEPAATAGTRKRDRSMSPPGGTSYFRPFQRQRRDSSSTTGAPAAQPSDLADIRSRLAAIECTQGRLLASIETMHLEMRQALHAVGFRFASRSFAPPPP